MAIFQTEVMICTTVYVQAANAREAFEKLKPHHLTDIDFRDQVLNGIEVSALPLDSEFFPEICLSPHMTFLLQTQRGRVRTPQDFILTE